MTETSFMKGFAYPKIIIDKFSFLVNVNHKFIGLVFDLMQEHPEMFKTTATTLIYILNLGTNYKSEIIYEMFKSFIYSDYVKPEVYKKIITNNESNDKIMLTNAMPILFSYYLLKNKEFKIFEPSLGMIHQELQEFMNNPTVYYESREYRLPELKPLFYTLSGFNFTEFLMYYAYYATFLIYGLPYKFYDEIGSESAQPSMLSDIDKYFESQLKTLTKETQIGINSFNASELYASYQKENQLEALQGCLNKLLNLEDIIKFRNAEINETHKTTLNVGSI